MFRARWVVIPLLLAVATPTRDERPALPIYVEVFLRESKTVRPQKVAGDLLRFDDDTLIIRSGKTERELRWTDLTATSAYTARWRTIDKQSADDWLKLGQFAWSMGAQKEAKTALATAVKLKPSLKSQVDQIIANPAGAALRPPTTGPTTSPSKEGANDQANENGDDSGDAPPTQKSGKKLDRSQIVKYQPVTPEQRAAAIDAAREKAQATGEVLGIKLAEIQTDHFIIFTDWDPREFGFLKENLEGAYAVVSREFEIPVKENVFVGKLPVYMIASHEVFKDFARKIDRFTAGDGVLGYYTSRDDGKGAHMAMWKPSIVGNNVREAERRWAYVLTHEFTHAFIARYRSNQRIPRWLNEGVAEVIADGKFPREGIRDRARSMAASNRDLSSLFDDNQMPGGEMYPVMMTMVQTLLARDRKAFLAYFDDLKAGAEPEAALQTHFGLDEKGLLVAWKRWVTTSN